jgi:3-oxoadipate enol-lactonase
VTRRESLVRTTEAELFVTDEGDPSAPAVVFSHSIMTTGDLWSGQVETVLDAGFRCVRYDARGHGRSVASPPPYAMDLLADDVVTLLDRLDLACAHFVGLSLGGIVGFHLASRHADRLASLVAAACRADSSTAFKAPWPDRIAIAKEQGIGPLVEPTIERWFGPQFRTGDGAGAVRAMIAQTSIDGYAGSAAALMEFDYRPAIPTLAMPTTFIVGALDGALPQAMQKLADEARCPLEVIEEAGHLPNVESRELFNAALARHLHRARA